MFVPLWGFQRDHQLMQQAAAWKFAFLINEKNGVWNVARKLNGINNSINPVSSLNVFFI